MENFSGAFTTWPAPKNKAIDLSQIADFKFIVAFYERGSRPKIGQHKMIKAIKQNDHTTLKELDVSTTEKMITVNWINYHEDYQLESDSFYGAIGWAIYCKADLAIFEILLEKGAPTENVRHCGKWYGARQAAHDLGLCKEIVGLFPKK